MALPSAVQVDLEAQTNDVTEPQSAASADPPPRNTSYPQPPTSADSQLQVTNTNEYQHGNPPAFQPADNLDVQRGENHGDSSDGLWSMYLTEAEKQDKEVTESWKGDTEGILVFTGLFSATVATFLIESYKMLSPDSGETTNALLTQISIQLFNISSGTPLTSVVTQSSQPFKPTASAVRVNALWFLSLVLSLNCALSATLMQQWARRYQELAQRRGATHRRGRMRAFIFDGITRFEMARAVATMPTLLHISVFLFFAGLIDFLFPIYKTIAYVTLGCISVFALAYAILTILPTICLNSPYGTPLSGMTWRISRFSVFGCLWTILKIGGLFRTPFLKLWRMTNQHVMEPHVLKKWRETLAEQVKTHRQLFSQSLRRSVELSAYKARSTVVTSALEWTLTALDEDKEIEDFALRMPGFFDSRVVTDATTAVLSLMSHQPNTDPIFGSRLYDLLKTCIPGTSLLTEEMRKHRLLICMKCLWYFGRAYNQPGVSQLLPSYLPNSLIPEVTRHIQTEEDSSIRVIGRCFVALVVNKLAADLELRTDSISDGELACLSAIPGTESGDVELLLNQPGVVALANMISLAFGEVGIMITDTVSSDVLDVAQQTLRILSEAPVDQENAGLQFDQTVALISGSDGKFERTLILLIHDFLCMCIQGTSLLTKEVRVSCLRTCLKGLWYFVRGFNQLGNSVPLPSYIYTDFTNPETTRRMRQEGDLSVRVMGRCVGALVVHKLTADISSRTILVSDAELACLSAILGTGNQDVGPLLSQPGAVVLANMISLMFDKVGALAADTVPLDLLDVVRQTLGIFTQAFPAQENADTQLYQTISLIDSSSGKFEQILVSRLLDLLNTCIPVTSCLTEGARTSCLRVCLKGLWYFGREFNQLGNSVPLPSYICIAFSSPEITRLIREHRDFTVYVMGRCVGALVVNKLAANINSRSLPVGDVELACLSAILGTKSHDVTLLLSHPGAIEFTNVAFLLLDNIYPFTGERVPSYMLDVVKQTFNTLSQTLPPELKTKLRLDQIGTSLLTVETYTGILHAILKKLWDFTREHNERRDSVPLPSYIHIAFTNPEMTRRIHQDAGLDARVIGRCISALVVNKLAPDPTSHSVLVSDAELACLSAILGTESRDVKPNLSRPGAVGPVNRVSLALGDASSLEANKVPPHICDVLETTLRILSQGLPVQENADLQLDRTVSVIDLSHDKFQRVIVSHLHGLLKTCLPGASHVTEEVRRSCLRMCLKSLWHCARAHHQLAASDPLPLYFPLLLASPEITHHLQTEQDPVARMIGRCFMALIVSRLANNLRLSPPNSLSGQVHNVELACLSAILGADFRENLPSPLHLQVINFRNIVSLMSGEIDILFPETGMAVNMPSTAQLTLYLLADRLRDRRFIPGGLPTDQWQSLQEIYLEVEKMLRSDRLKDQTVRTLDLLQQALEEILPAGLSQDTAMQDLGR